MELPQNSLLGFNADHTLVRIDPDPANPEVHPDVPRLLATLAERHTVVVTSGRPCVQIHDIIGVESVMYVGLNGLQRLDPGGGTLWTHPGALQRVPDLERLRATIVKWPDVNHLKLDVELREAGVILAVNWRNVGAEQLAASIGERIAELADQASLPHVATDRGIDVVAYGNDPGGAFAQLIVALQPELAGHVGDSRSDAMVQDTIREHVGDGLLPKGFVVGVTSANTPPEILRCAEEQGAGVEGLLLDGPEGVLEFIRTLV